MRPTGRPAASQAARRYSDLSSTRRQARRILASRSEDAAWLDEILVIANNCTDRTAALATDAGARVVDEAEPGYGAALMRGMSEAKGDIFVLVEADGSFAARDLEKLLIYLDDASMVMGTRTTRQMDVRRWRWR